MLNIAYMIGIATAGYFAWPIWTPAWAALIGVGIYHFDRPQIWRHYEAMRSDGAIGGIAMLVGGLYAVQLLLAAVLYGIGRAIGYFV